MAVEFQIYLHDVQTASDNNNTRRSIQEIKDILIDVDPSSIVPQWIKTTPNGYIASYSNDSHINFIFNQDNIEKFVNNQLKVELSSETNLRRQVVITGVTPEIYSKPPTDIIQELQRVNQIAILKLSVYESRLNNKRYIFATVSTKESKEQIVNKGTIKLYESNFTVLSTRPKQRSTTSGSNHPTRTPATSSAPRSGQASTPTNNWGVQHQYFNGATNTNYPPPIWSSPSNTPPQGPQTNSLNRYNQYHYRSSQGLSAFDVKFIAETHSRVCETLSYGLENPTAYVSLINQSLAHQGFPEIYIAESALNDCRELYFTKLQGKYPTSLSQTSPNQQTTTSSITTSSSVTPTTSQTPTTTQTTSQTQLTIPSPASSGTNTVSTNLTNSISTPIPSANLPIPQTSISSNFSHPTTSSTPPLSHPNTHPVTTTLSQLAVSTPSLYPYTDPPSTNIIHSNSVPDPTTTLSNSASNPTPTSVPTSLLTRCQQILTHRLPGNSVSLLNICKFILVILPFVTIYMKFSSDTHT